MSGYVYCAYNELFKENLYKIGKAKKLKNRLDQLSRDTGVPSKFKLLIATKTENYERLEREVFKILRPFRLPRKEFFQLEGKLDHNFLEDLFSNLDGETIYPNNKSQEEFTSNNSKRTYSIPPFSFKKVNIEIGSVLTSVFDEAYTCEVVSENKVKFKDETTSLSKAARTVNKIVTNRDWQSIQGPLYWKYKGKKLTDLINAN